MWNLMMLVLCQESWSISDPRDCKEQEVYFFNFQLFGGIIEHGLVNMIPLGLALRFVLVSLFNSLMG